MRAEKQNEQKIEKKPYAAPELLVYGDIREITQSKGIGNKNESHSKSSP